MQIMGGVSVAALISGHFTHADGRKAQIQIQEKKGNGGHVNDAWYLIGSSLPDMSYGHIWSSP